MKRFFAFLLTFVLLTATMVPSTLAVSSSQWETEVVYTELGDIEIEVATIIYSSGVRSNSHKVDKVAKAKHNGKVIAEVTLSATFGYDGKTSWVESASSSHTTYDGWSYGSEKITKSGGAASLSGKLTHLIYGNYTVNISITCSPTGQIS